MRLLLKMLPPSNIHGALELNQFLSDGKELFRVENCPAPDLDEAEVEFASKVVGESSVVVVDSQVGRAHLQHFPVSELSGNIFLKPQQETKT